VSKVIEFGVQVPGERIDRLASEQVAGASRAAVQKLIRAGLVLVNGAPVKANYRVRAGDQIIVYWPQEETAPLQAEPIPLDLVYEDEYLAVVNKPAGMVVHPACGHQAGTLVNAVLSHAPDLSDEEQPDRPGIVHRLDKDTSGLIVVAKNPTVRAALQRAFQARTVKKLYRALVEGQVSVGHGLITARLGRDPQRRKQIAVVAGGRPAETEYWVLERFARHTYLEVQPHTGRTHQIRVHLAYIGHPVVGDRVYGYRKQRVAVERQFLHAARLAFHHPVTGEFLDLSAPLPDDLQRVLDELRKEED